MNTPIQMTPEFAEELMRDAVSITDGATFGWYTQVCVVAEVAPFGLFRFYYRRPDDDSTDRLDRWEMDDDGFVYCERVVPVPIVTTRYVDADLANDVAEEFAEEGPPVPMILWCPVCRGRHIDRGRHATDPHNTHACTHCGHCWRPALVNTVGVEFLPGFEPADEVE